MISSNSFSKITLFVVGFAMIVASALGLLSIPDRFAVADNQIVASISSFVMIQIRFLPGPTVKR